MNSAKRILLTGSTGKAGSKVVKEFCKRKARTRLRRAGCGPILINDKEKKMNPSTHNEIQGSVHEVKGKVKETAGKVTNNPNLQAEGSAEKNTGKVEKKLGQIEKVFEK
jgi:uncharacterized protein YjbJ (UPF0337 family)